MARKALALCLLIAAVAAAAAPLPKAPEGYAWHEVPAIHASFLVPKGWHFREQSENEALTLYITQDAFTPPEKFEVGASINVFRRDPAAGARIKRMLEKLASAHAVELHRGSSGGPFTTLACQFESPREGKEPVRTHVMGIANAETDTVYLVFFESPASQWDATWTKGRTILGKLALETGV
jgi:hypothetical protein